MATSDINSHADLHKTSPTLPSVRLHPTSLGQLIEEICNQDTSTTLIACCSRSYFLAQLIEHTKPESIQSEDAPPPSTSEPLEDPSEAEEPVVNPPPRLNPLLIPTLKLIAASARVKLVFCSTNPILRAYLSSLPFQTAVDEESHNARILILNVLALHRDTTEFTVQGLSRSFSLIASVNKVLRRRTELIECTDVDHLVATHGGSPPWDAEVPLLSGSIKIGDAGQGWASRTIGISKFACRWFEFV